MQKLPKRNQGGLSMNIDTRELKRMFGVEPSLEPGFEFVPKELSPMADQLLKVRDRIIVPLTHPMTRQMKKVVKHRKKIAKKSKARNRRK